MKRKTLPFITIVLLTVLAAACSSMISQKSKSNITEYAAFELVGEGTQTYECKPNPKTEDPDKFIWTAPKPAQPKADLLDSKGQKVGTHYTGPTWESDADHSKVVGSVQAQAPAPNAAADIPWVFLSVKSTEGTGMFSKVKSIQRVNTKDGVAPKGACDPNAAPLAVKYSATYIFHTDKP